ncbi:MAG TPA: hypothetical protein VGC45_04485 [Gryllotalpicola sp.]
MHLRPRLAAPFLTALLAVAALAGCASDGWSAPHPEPSAVGVVGPGFVPTATPSPEATVEPVAGSWRGVHPSKGYRVVLLTAGDDAPTRELVAAVRDWAHDEDVALRTVRADGELVDGIVRAMKLEPDLIVSAGNELVDPLATVTASHLDQKFLVVGAEVAEPTANVTAADWTGASFRGEGLGMSSGYDPGTFTAARCGAAVRAGVAAVLTGLTGVVLWID